MENFITKKGFLSLSVSASAEDDPFAGMTPSQRLKKKKEIKAQEEAEQLKKFTKEAASNYQKATQRKQEEFHSSKKTGSHAANPAMGKAQSHIVPVKASKDMRPSEDTYMVSSIGSSMSGMTLNDRDVTQGQAKKFSSHHDYENTFDD